MAAVRASGPATNAAVVYVESLDAATSRAAWYAKLIAGRAYHPIHVRGVDGVDPRGRWLEFSRRRSSNRDARAGGELANAVLDYVWGLAARRVGFVTVSCPEVFARPSLIERRPPPDDVLAQAPAALRSWRRHL